MKLLVCIKQVPATQQVEVDPETGVLKRDGVLSKINPYDLYALEAALTLRERLGGSITVLSMGPNQAEDALREALWMGADRGVLLSDRRFAGADVLATSYTLSQGIRALGGFDLILMGRQTTDGDTAQVGPAVAQWLGIPHAALVSRIDEADASHLTVSQELARSVETVRMSYPCLITVEKDSFEPRLPSYRRRLAIGGGRSMCWGWTIWRTKIRSTTAFPARPRRWSVSSRPRLPGKKCCWRVRMRDERWRSC